jgi:Ser/Thr protein kinase RdoA (MazF antagonist)
VDYQPVPAWRRPDWNDVSLNFIEQYLPAAEVRAREAHETLMGHFGSLPTDPAGYGLVHQDAHQNNFFIDDDGTLTLFDFDDCAYSWYVNDIAVVLFYISMDAADLGYPDNAAFTREFMPHFLRGYRQEYNLSPDWLKEIPAFLKLRELELYAVVHRDFQIEGIQHWDIERFRQVPGFDVHNDGHQWIAAFMQDRKPRIDQGLPFIDFDFESLS